MEDWVTRALKRWPNVPALYGWLKLDRRGRWLIKGETIGRRQIVDVIGRNYGVDERGCWYFQNGPQRGYMELERAPFILHAADSPTGLRTHTALSVANISEAFLDEDGGMYLRTEHGPGALLDSDLDWALARMFFRTASLSEAQVATAISLPSGTRTELALRMDGGDLAIHRLDTAVAPTRLGFVLNPTPIDKSSAQADPSPF